MDTPYISTVYITPYCAQICTQEVQASQVASNLGFTFSKKNKTPVHWYKNRSFRASNMSLNAIHSRTTSHPPDLFVANLVAAEVKRWSG